MERTLIIIKPDALVLGIVGKIISMIENGKVKITALKLVRLTKKDAREFYSVHRGKPFYKPLVKFMTSNPCFVMVGQGSNAVKSMRKLMGNTNPLLAEKGTIRKLYATDNRHNAIHGSDSAVNAEKEIKFFFNENELKYWKKRSYKI